MSYQANTVITVIAPESNPLHKADVNDLVDLLQHQGSVVTDVSYLDDAEKEAVDIFFYTSEADEIAAGLKELEDNITIDLVMQPVGNRRKRLFISDMDSTIIQQECIDELADKLGIKPKIAEITDRAMNGELDFKEALRERVGLLKGLDVASMNDVLKSQITLTPGAKTLVATMKRYGAKTVLVSGGFTFFTEKVAELCGFEEQEANILEIQDGELTGLVKEPILDKQAKLTALHHYCNELGIHHSDVLAAGDGANDLPMLQAAGMGVAFHAKPNVRAQTNSHISHNDLSALLYVQGFARSEWAE